MKRTLHIVIFFGSLVAIWWVAVASGQWSPVILPSPASVADYLWSSTLDGSLIDATLVTVRRLVVGYLIGVAIGLPLGLLTSGSQTLRTPWARSRSDCRLCRACAGCRWR
jgi:NitT/TauT family transport system permease protein